MDHPRSRGLARRGIACASIALVLVASIGLFPSPEVISRWMGTFGSQAYPCQGGRCGCASAFQCWTACRCHTLREKVAWARRQGVAVPAYVDLSALDLCQGPPVGRSACSCGDTGVGGLCAGGSQNSCGGGCCGDDAPPPTMPTLTPLGCRGMLPVLLYFAPPGWFGSTATIIADDGMDAHQAIPIGSDRRLSSRVLDIDPPPPRARCASIAL